MLLFIFPLVLFCSICSGTLQSSSSANYPSLCFFSLWTLLLVFVQGVEPFSRGRGRQYFRNVQAQHSYHQQGVFIFLPDWTCLPVSHPTGSKGKHKHKHTYRPQQSLALAKTAGCSHVRRVIPTGRKLTYPSTWGQNSSHFPALV